MNALFDAIAPHGNEWKSTYQTGRVEMRILIQGYSQNDTMHLKHKDGP